MKSNRTTIAGFVSAILLVGALAALAQQANPTNTNSAAQPATTDTDRNVDINRTANRNNATRTADSATGLSKLDAKTTNTTVRASKLIGTNLKNSNDESVGEINDMVIDAKSGKVRYVAVTYGGFLGLGSKLFAVPFEAFRVRQNTSALRPGDFMLTLDVTKDQLQGSQGFDNDHWPDFANANLAQELDRRYKIDRTQTRR
jgi:sporulation protein YlmC with PRC-barrel domain